MYVHHIPHTRPARFTPIATINQNLGRLVALFIVKKRIIPHKRKTHYHQVASTRHDFLPAAYLDRLSILQVCPMPG